MVKTYVNVFYSDVMHYEKTMSLAYSTYASVILMIVIPIAGIFVDKIGKVSVMRFAVVSVVLFDFSKLPSTAISSVLM